MKAISVNPVDTKVRAGFNADTPRVLGWDAVGVVKAVGSAVTLFAAGDEVWYAGALGRPGSNSEFQLVDERIVARKPRSLTGMTVIGTASRAESQKWVREAGAHHVIDHSKPLADELARIGVKAVTHVASLTNTDQHYPQLIAALAPQGKLALIDDPETLDVVPLKAKSISLHWEFMFTRSMFATPDMIAQHQLLTRVAALIDDNTIKTTLGVHYGAITAANLQKAHAQLETGRSVGKIVLEGF